MTEQLEQVERVEILTLQDNYIDIAAHDDTDIVKRATPEDAAGIRLSVLAEHGFSALLSLSAGGRTRRALFDFGFSEGGALQNAKTLGVDAADIDALVLSHGHIDHHGGMLSFVESRGRAPIDLLVHPAAFRGSRYVKTPTGGRIRLPPPDRGRLEQAGVRVTASRTPHLLLGGTLLFLGEIPRHTAFEQGMPSARYEDGGVETFDPIEDDSAVVAHLRGRGLVVLSGCAHSGIVNTVAYARQVTGIADVFLVMGGFHLTGAEMAPVIEQTITALKAFDPRYVVPTHCTGREATSRIEREMPDRFLLNMSGTSLSFTA